MNPPRPVSEHHFETHDGVQLFYRQWPAIAPRRGAVVMFHRGHEHSGRIAHLPDELRAARWLLKEREEFRAKAHREAEEIIADAKSHVARMVQRTEVVKAANQQAQTILDDAEASEEIGLEPGFVQVLGHLPMYTTGTAFMQVTSFAVAAIADMLATGKDRCLATSSGNTGAALAAWAAAYTTDTVPRVTRATETLRAANAASVASANCDASTSRDANAPTAPASPARRSVLAEFIKPEYIAEAAAQRAAGVLQPQLSTEELERFALSGSLARLQERRALWRAYKRKMDAPDWQVGF